MLKQEREFLIDYADFQKAIQNLKVKEATWRHKEQIKDLAPIFKPLIELLRTMYTSQIEVQIFNHEIMTCKLFMND